jgi:adhesin/invasin
LAGNGDGTFRASVSFSTIAASAIASADFNGDGNLDNAAGGLGGGLYVFLGSGNGTFTELPANPSFPESTSLLAADLNDDGHLDLLAVSVDSILVAYQGTGTGTFAAQAPQYYGGYCPFVAAMTKGRLPDIVVTGSDGVWTYINASK